MTRFDPRAAQQLQYEATRRSLRRRRVLVLVTVTVLLCAVTPFAVRYAKMAAERMRVVRLYQQCAQHTLPPTTVVWEEDPQLVGQLRDYQRADAHADREAAYFVPDPWKQLNAAVGQQIQTWGTLFLHERQTPDGKNRLLVGVDIAGWSRGGPVVMFARVRTISPAAPVRLPRQEKVDHPSVRLSANEGVLRIFAGQVDPKDASHFTIDYAIGEQRGTIDGWLKNDGTVLLEPRGP